MLSRKSLRIREALRSHVDAPHNLMVPSRVAP
jgi:hypothetical protein